MLRCPACRPRAADKSLVKMNISFPKNKVNIGVLTSVTQLKPVHTRHDALSGSVASCLGVYRTALDLHLPAVALHLNEGFAVYKSIIIAGST